MIYARQMNKSNLDRSSRSVIDSYKEKFRLSNQNLEALKNFLLNAQSTAEELRDIMSKQVIDMHEQIDEAIEEAEAFCSNSDATIETLEEIDDALDDVENDLDDVQDDIGDKLDCLEACYGSCQEDQSNTCTTGCEIALDCGETAPCNEGGCGANESCVNGLEEDCQDVSEGNLPVCFSLEVSCEQGCQASGEAGCQNIGEASCVYDIETYYCVYTSDASECLGILDYAVCADEEQEGCIHIGDGCVKIGEDGCMAPGESYCIDQGEQECIYVGEPGCRYTGEDLCEMVGEENCTIPGESNCQIPGQDGCILAGQKGCIAAGEEGCTWMGEDNCDYEGETGADECQYTGLEGCNSHGEDNCGYADEDYTNCTAAVLIACGADWGSCGSVQLCKPAYADAAGCEQSTEGCRLSQTCGSTCNWTCANGECGTSTGCTNGQCGSSCNSTCANGECSGPSVTCGSSCNTTCANGEGCGASQTCTGCGLEGGCEGCTGTCQAPCVSSSNNPSCCGESCQSTWRG